MNIIGEIYIYKGNDGPAIENLEILDYNDKLFKKVITLMEEYKIVKFQNISWCTSLNLCGNTIYDDGYDWNKVHLIVKNKLKAIMEEHKIVKIDLWHVRNDWE
ncbi:unnamed protein product [marine sediment metagenome]|uniref:Uncharacterized protein n=1 Tax=marine sediment metagenome TaxID=412755 RepID=X1J4A7_9ZZZZ